MKIDKTCIFLGQLPKCMIISLLIDVFMLIPHPKDIYISPHMTNIQQTHFPYKRFLKYVLFLQVIDEKGNDFAEDR